MLIYTVYIIKIRTALISLYSDNKILNVRHDLHPYFGHQFTQRDHHWSRIRMKNKTMI